MNGSVFGFVIPRFGEGIAGGIETLVGTLARKLHERGDEVVVLTTCARDNRTWENFYPPGDAIEFGVRVKRFEVDPRDLEVWIPLQIRISEGQHLTVEEQLEWMAQSVNSATLYQYVRDQADSYSEIFFAPYLFGTTFWGSLIRPDKSVLIPCLHDEHYAYLDVIGSMCRQVSGIVFNALPEMTLAAGLYGDLEGGVVGMGFEPLAYELDAPYFAERFPYLVYLGRKETGKNAHILIDYFLMGKRLGTIPEEMRLVIVGGGSFSDLLRPAASDRPDIMDVTHVSDEDKYRILAHSVALCQPSVNESFSIVIMEAWLAGVPVIVHGACAVTMHHAVESGGGLYFSDAEDFAGVVTALSSDSDLRGKLTAAGKRYVAEEFSWNAVLGRFDKVIDRIRCRREQLPKAPFPTQNS